MDKHIWIQLENHPWDLAPNNFDRMTGQKMNESPQSFTLTSPETSVSRDQRMYKPIEDALLLRRYDENWKEPQDQKVNPWDLNERDPTDKGTMGTIPGPVIECNVGDKVIVHFRNKDNRQNVKKLNRLHSLHTHGFVFNIVHDGAYPLSPPDPNQPVGDEADLWKDINEPPTSDFKRGDRVPPGGTFTYTWNTFGWPTTAGVWLYHDHSIDDMTNVQLGAIGIVVIHNLNDAENDVLNPDLPGGSNIGSPLEGLVFRTPPTNARYLVLLHELQGGYMCINGRWKLGNAPTFVAGLTTKMRFGVVAMGDMAHTFHIHGHRWVIQGPDGINAGDIQGSIQNRSVSQFEDTRIMGAANSFNFTIRQGSFMGSLSGDPTQAPGLGEWHTHCHIPNHMMNGMMGSLLIVNQGTPIKGLLQWGVPHVELDGGHDGGQPPTNTVTVDHMSFEPHDLTVPSGTQVTFDFREINHTVMTVSSPNAQPISINNGGGNNDAVSPVPRTRVVTVTGNSGGEINYQCGIHGTMMTGVIHISNNGDHGGGHAGGH
jgi:FtsP/CotA-like multicopper oxidase with cupredoxin domain/plastocyanin